MLNLQSRGVQAVFSPPWTLRSSEPPEELNRGRAPRGLHVFILFGFLLDNHPLMCQAKKASSTQQCRSCWWPLNSAFCPLNPTEDPTCLSPALLPAVSTGLKMWGSFATLQLGLSRLASILSCWWGWGVVDEAGWFALLSSCSGSENTWASPRLLSCLWEATVSWRQKVWAGSLYKVRRFLQLSALQVPPLARDS